MWATNSEQKFSLKAHLLQQRHWPNGRGDKATVEKKVTAMKALFPTNFSGSHQSAQDSRLISSRIS